MGEVVSAEMNQFSDTKKIFKLKCVEHLPNVLDNNITFKIEHYKNIKRDEQSRTRTLNNVLQGKISKHLLLDI